MSNETQTKDVVPTMVTLTEAPQLPATRDALRGSEPSRDVSAPPAIPEMTVKHIAGAIAAVTAKIGIVSKRGVNQFHHYKYASMQDILQKLTPLLAKHGLVIMQNEIGRSMFDSDRTIAIQYAFTIFHTSGEVWPERPVQTGMSRCRDSRGGFDDKSINKCHTAARKYFLLALFQIATGEEDDADEDKPISRPIPKHDPETIEIDDEIPEWDSPRGPPVAAADKAGASQSSTPPRGAPAETTHERLGRLRNRLAIAAESGMRELKKMWEDIDPPDQRLLEPDLRSIYQPRARTIDDATTL